TWRSIPRPHRCSSVRTANVIDPCRVLAHFDAAAMCGVHACAWAGHRNANRAATARRRIAVTLCVDERARWWVGTEYPGDPRGPARARPGRADPAGAGARRAVPPARPGRLRAVRLRARREPHLDAPR